MATLAPPWRGRLRVTLAAYGMLSLVHIGGIADIEHAFAIAVGLGLGPFLAGRRPRFAILPLTRRDYRLLAACFFVLAGVEVIYLSISPVGGSLGSTLSPQLREEALNNADDMVGAAIQAVIWFWLARSLFVGRRWAWRWAVGLVSLALLANVAGTIQLLVQHHVGLPASLYEGSGNALGLVVLIAGRRAFRNPSRRKARRSTASMLSPADEDQRRRPPTCSGGKAPSSGLLG